MILLSKRSLLAIAAVVDVALHARGLPVGSKALSERHKLPPRHLENLLQALVHARILRGVRGPGGGYVLARAPSQISAGEIVRVAVALSTADRRELGSLSPLLRLVVEPGVRQASAPFLANLEAINIDMFCRDAQAKSVPAMENARRAA